MSSNENRQTDPLGGLFQDIKKILEFLEVKDMSAATENETEESKEWAEMWINAKLENDSYLTYRMYWDVAMFQEVLSNVKINDVKYWISHPYNVPIDFRETLLLRGREAFFRKYEERNDYYRMISGLPPIDTPASEFIYLTEPMRNQLHATDLPVHLLSPLIQNNYMNTKEYQEVLKNHPDKKYLRYLGMYKVDILTARHAKDFEIIRYPLNRSDINPNLVREFSSLYDEYREYVMTVLYNKQFENLYEGYRDFMGVLILSFVLLQLPNKAVESISTRKYLDDSILYLILSMYGIPSSLLLTTEVRRELVINMLKLTREKGTDDVYYDLVKILGYQDVVISKLMLMKGQKFGSRNGEVTDEVEPYFLQLDLKDKNPYETINKGNAPIHSYKKIIENDPTWWDLPDTRKILEESNYTIADSKYIMVEAVVHQMRYMFESIYFTRMIIDNRSSTDTFMVEIPELFGTESMSIYDLMVFILAATCMENGLSGEFVSDESRLLATAGFNFDMDLDSFTEFVNTTKYVDKERVMGFMENLTMQTESDINRLFNDVMYPMREWLEQKIVDATEREEFLEYESIYKALFTYDITRSTFKEDFRSPMESIRAKYDLSPEDLRAYQHFYPREITGEAITTETIEGSRYNTPFLNRTTPIDWFIHIVIDTPYGEDDRGKVYLHDILNSEDIRTITNPNGLRPFMDYEDEEVGWEINQQAVDKALELISQLPEGALHKAFFQVDTFVKNSGGKRYVEGEKLPSSIRAGIYKEILKDKIMMDAKGLAVPPTTYLDYLYRKNERLYDLLVKNDRFELDHASWLDDVMRIILALETDLNIHLKYFEQSVVGPDPFFKPLITLIKHFKSTLVDFAHTGLKYVFADKIDIGGNSNMFRLYDEVEFIVHFVTMANLGFESTFGLYDAEHGMKYHIRMEDRPESIMGDRVQYRTEHMGSLRLVDEMKFFLNGKEIDPDGYPSHWISGEPNTGRWSEEDDVLMKDYKASTRVHSYLPDMEGWKEFVESYTPIE